MKRIALLFALLSFLSVEMLYAQTTVTGTVTSAEDGQPIPGASVRAKNVSGVGTVTDASGSYSLEVPGEAEILVYSFTGMATKEEAINGRTTINVGLQTQDIGLDEVVVTAFGISRDKKSLGYSVQEVSGDDVNKVEKGSVIEGLSGKISGVSISNNTNMGGSNNIVIRGASSLTGDNRPLFVVDGVPVNNMNSNTSYQQTGGAGYDYGDPISDINPNDIESMSVLKGSAATALYGSRAANGVIIIETKKGSKTKGGGKNISVSVNSTTMFRSMDESTFPEYQQEYGAGYGPYNSASEHPYLLNYDFDGDGNNDYIVPSTADASRGAAFDAVDEVFKWRSFFPGSPDYNEKVPYEAAENGPAYFFQTGRTLTNNVSVSGGTDVSTFRLSYTNTDMTGMMPNSERKKNNVSLNASYDLLDNLTVTSKVTYANTYTKGRNRTGYSDNILSSFRQWWNVGVDMKRQEDYYNLNETNMTWNPNSENDLSPIYWDNYYFQRFQSYQDDERDRVIGNIRLDYDLTENLSFNAQYSLDSYTFLQQERKAVGSVAGAFGVGFPDVQSGYTRTDISFREQNFNAQVKYNKKFSESFDLNALLGTNIRRERYERVRKSTNGGLAVPDVYALSNSASSMLPPEETLQKVGVNGVFGSVSLGIMDMLYIDGSLRRDVSSTLPQDNNDYYYPSVSASFLVDQVANLDWLNLAKIRGNWAQVGSDAPWGRVNDSYRVVAPFGSNTLVTQTTFKNNPDLKPEISTTYEGGLELAMFNNRLRADFALFQEQVENQIIPLAVSRATGFSSKYVNVGQMDKNGIELSLGATAIKTSDFSWDLQANWSTYESVVADLGENIENLQLASLQGGVTINAREDEKYGAIQGTDFVYHNGQKVLKQNGQYLVTGTSDQVLGHIQPDWNAGLNNSLSYKGFSLSFLIDVQMGGDLFSLDHWYGMATGLYPETAETNFRGNPERAPVSEGGGVRNEGLVWEDANGNGEVDDADNFTPNSEAEIVINGDRYSADGYAVSPNGRYMFKQTYVKLREASISYSLPQSIIGGTFFNQVNLSVVGSNLWIIHKDLPYADPEASQSAGNVQGWQSGVYPTARNIGFKVNLRF